MSTRKCRRFACKHMLVSEALAKTTRFLQLYCTFNSCTCTVSLLPVLRLSSSEFLAGFGMPLGARIPKGVISQNFLCYFYDFRFPVCLLLHPSLPQLATDLIIWWTERQARFENTHPTANKSFHNLRALDHTLQCFSTASNLNASRCRHLLPCRSASPEDAREPAPRANQHCVLWL